MRRRADPSPRSSAAPPRSSTLSPTSSTASLTSPAPRDQRSPSCRVGAAQAKLAEAGDAWPGWRRSRLCTTWTWRRSRWGVPGECHRASGPIRSRLPDRQGCQRRRDRGPACDRRLRIRGGNGHPGVPRHGDRGTHPGEPQQDQRPRRVADRAPRRQPGLPGDDPRHLRRPSLRQGGRPGGDRRQHLPARTGGR